MPEEPGQGGPAVDRGAAEERTLVNGAVRTDFILSAEIMVISLATVNAGRSSSMALLPKTLILVLVAVTLTAVVYGAVALIVKMDDIGLVLEGRERRGSRRVGAALVAAMPVVLSVLSTVGIAAMLWVGGHILVTGANTLGWHAPADLLHHLAAPAHEVPGVGGLLAWLIDTLGSAVVAIVLGGLLVGITHLVPSRRHDGHRSA
ncbi:Inner membrane protein YedI [bioreactor metagenome]|uniref:Inner membrane protein YedI n=2 Tax=root TaxID=1 RepID=A0A645DY08_9ZZZZ